MPSHIPEEIINEIQSRCDIVEIIGRYIPLRKAGNNFKALCPFHNERTPSFVVSPSKQIYHCFGCASGGNVFGFVMNHEHLEFVDAVKLLADKCGVVIPEKDSGKSDGFTKDLWEVNRFASEFFHKQLYGLPGKQALAYIRKRSISDETIKKFMVGYAPGGGDLIKEAAKKNFSAEILLKAGLAVKTDRGVNDMFRNRLIFPIHNTISKVAGFSGRVLDDGLPKYLNTPETNLFHKGKILYGLNVSKGDIAKAGRAIICEGYFDFLRIYQEGVHEVVASQGTAFTTDHVHLLRRYASTIFISFDGDSAGSQASMRGLEMFLNEGIQVKIIEISKGYDPDTFIHAKGVAEFRKLIGGAQDILDTKLACLCKENNIATTDGKIKVIADILPDAVKIKNEVKKGQFIKNIAFRLSVPEESIWLELKRIVKNSQQHHKQPQSGAAERKFYTKVGDAAGERHLIQLLLDNDPLPDCIDAVVIDQMKHPLFKKILELIVDLKKNGRWNGPNSLIALLNEKELLTAFSSLAAEEIPHGLDKTKVIGDCIYDIQKRDKENRIKGLIVKMEESEKQKQDVSGLMQEIHNLQKELTQLNKLKI